MLGVTRAVHGFRTLLSGLVLILVWGGACIGTSAVPLGAAQRAAARVPILVYHTVDESGNTYSVTPRQLNQQCRWLVEHGYTSITLRQFWRAARGLADLPPNPVILTNDDGDPSARTFARILERYGLVGNYFVNNVSPLTRRQIRSLAQRGSVEAHTVSHVALSGLDYEDQVAEIAENQAYLEEITGTTGALSRLALRRCERERYRGRRGGGHRRGLRPRWNRGRPRYDRLVHHPADSDLRRRRSGDVRREGHGRVMRRMGWLGARRRATSAYHLFMCDWECLRLQNLDSSCARGAQ